MIFSRLTFGFLLLTIAAFFCAQSVEAAGPRITKKVYFDIKHGDESLGRSKSLASRVRTIRNTFAP